MDGEVVSDVREDVVGLNTWFSHEAENGLERGGVCRFYPETVSPV